MTTPGSETATASANVAPSTTSATKILLVEDTPETMEMIRLFLRGAGEVTCAADAQSALAIATAEDQAYTLILMDINLGRGKSGIDVTKELRALPMHHNTPIIALTAYAMKGDKENILASGFSDYLSKPFTRAELLALIEKYSAN